MLASSLVSCALNRVSPTLKVIPSKISKKFSANSQVPFVLSFSPSPSRSSQWFSYTNIQWYRLSELSSNLISQSAILPSLIGELFGEKLLSKPYNFSSFRGPSINLNTSQDASICTMTCDSPKEIMKLF